IEAERQARITVEINRPIDPVVWIILGGLILFITGLTYLDSMLIADAGQPKDFSLFQLLPALLVRLFGRMPTVIGLGLLGGFSLVAGVIGWLRKRSAPPPESG